MKYVYTFILSLLAVAVYSQNKKLVILGSSTSACTGPSSFSFCYVARLDAYYDGNGQPIDITQLAVGGYNPYKGMPTSYTPPALPGGYDYTPDPNNNITRAVNLHPDVILVNYPTNAFDALSIGQIMFAFRTIRDSGVKAGIPVFITTSQPRQSFPFNNMSARDKLKEVRDSILVQFGTTAINFWDGIADPTTYQIIPTYNADDTHLNDAGHDMLFQRVRDANILLASVLPVKLSAFSVSQQQSHVNINWTVADEVPGASYEVQRSLDGSSFQPIYSSTSFSSAVARTYNVTDANVHSGMYYYRLKITEGLRSFFSKVVMLSMMKNKIALKNFSVDALRKQLVINMSATETMRMQLNLINSSGQLVQKNMQLLQAGENRLSFPLSTMPAGTYWAEAIADQQKIFTKGFRVQ